MIKQKTMLITGPCSAESEEQVLKIAKKLKENNNCDIFRAGIWKPRTRPGGFEGVGSIGLKWLTNVKKETGLPIAIEVANVKQVYEALKNKVDYLWIGARTTTNPFAVQEIADALQGVDIPIMIKNPINPDINLWIGAIERFLKAGINDIMAIHRGFSSYKKNKYRNTPIWQIPIDLNREMPGIKIICDPSHISGKKELLQEVSQKALDLCFDGLMIEVHNNPNKALSDAEQQITPENFKKLEEKLIARKERFEDTKYIDSIHNIRAKIDIKDNEIIDKLQERFEIVKRIGEYKKKQNITVLQTKRWADILFNRIKKAEKLGFSKEFISKFFKSIHEESINWQIKIMK